MIHSVQPVVLIPLAHINNATTSDNANLVMRYVLLILMSLMQEPQLRRWRRGFRSLHALELTFSNRTRNTGKEYIAGIYFMKFVQKIKQFSLSTSNDCSLNIFILSPTDAVVELSLVLIDFKVISGNLDPPNLDGYLASSVGKTKCGVTGVLVTLPYFCNVRLKQCNLK